jgi:hypothetical protein
LPPVGFSGLAPLALGESVMLGALPNLQEAGFRVDAAVSRQGPSMADLVEQLGAADQLGDLVVIQIGTNGSISQATLDRMMAQMPADRVPRVRFMTVFSPRKWNAANNALIRALPDKYRNVEIIDWEAAASRIRICSDHIHIACGEDMQQYYADQIFLGIDRPDLVRSPLSTSSLASG